MPNVVHHRCVCACAYVYIYIYTHTHTYTYTYIVKSISMLYTGDRREVAKNRRKALFDLRCWSDDIRRERMRDLKKVFDSTVPESYRTGTAASRRFELNVRPSVSQ
jgi:predicted P-loop ATPase/GTPase